MTLRAAIAITSIIFGILLSLYLIAFNHSHYLSWQLLPKEGTTLLIVPNHNLLSELESPLKLLPQQEVLTLISHSSHLAFNKDHQSATLIITPKNPFSSVNRQLISQSLTDRDWHVTEEGRRIVARQGASAPLNQQNTYLRALMNRIRNTLPKNQLAVGTIHPDHNPLSDQPIKLLVNRHVEQEKQFLTIAITSLNEPLAVLANNNSIEASEVTISMPTALISALPSPLQDAWNDRVHQALNLSYAKSNFLTQINNTESTTITISDQQAGLALTGTTETISSATAAFIATLQKEEASTHPVPKAFQLPDGTIGYERVPGDVQDIFSVNIDEHGCVDPIVNHPKVWFCRQDDRASFANTKDLAIELINQENTSDWHVTLGQSAIENLNFSPAISLQAQAIGSALNAHIELK